MMPKAVRPAPLRSFVYYTQGNFNVFKVITEMPGRSANMKKESNFLRKNIKGIVDFIHNS